MNETLRRCREALAMLAEDGDLSQWTDAHATALREAVSVYAAESKDAERYRYLRNRAPRDVLERSGPDAGCWIDCETSSGPAALTLLTGADADSAIDAAMEAT